MRTSSNFALLQAAFWSPEGSNAGLAAGESRAAEACAGSGVPGAGPSSSGDPQDQAAIAPGSADGFRAALNPEIFMRDLITEGAKGEGERKGKGRHGHKGKAPRPGNSLRLSWRLACLHIGSIAEEYALDKPAWRMDFNNIKPQHGRSDEEDEDLAAWNFLEQA